MNNDELVAYFQARIRDYEQEIDKLKSENALLKSENKMLNDDRVFYEQKITQLTKDAEITQASLDMATGNPVASAFIGSTPQDILEDAAHQEMPSENAKRFL